MRALLILLMLSFEAGAATYYIDPTVAGGGAGTEGDPLNAPPAASASDVWYFARGTTLATTAQITLQSSMTLGAYGTGAKPIISCTCAAGDVTLYAFNKTGITFEDIEVRRNSTSDIRGVITLQGTGGGHVLDNVTLRGGYNNLRILADAPSITVRDSDFADAYDDNIYADVSVAFTVTDSTFSTPSTGTVTGDNIQLDSWDGTATITNNVMTPGDNTKQGLIGCGPLTSAATLNASGNSITGGRYGINTCVAGTIARNWLTGQAERGINFNPANASVAQFAESNIIAGDMTTAAIYVESAGAVAVDVDINNNSMAGGFARGIAIKSDVASGAVTAKNNVILGDGSSGQIGTGCGTVCAQFSEDYSRFANLETNSSEALGANSTAADPAFLGGSSPTTADGFIPSNTALFRTGTKVGDYNDFSGCRFATPPSIGAYEMACGGRGVTRSSVTRTAISR